MARRTAKRRTGFTLLELLFTIALIGTLAAMLLPALARAREQAWRAACLSNLSQLGIAMWMYAQEHNGQLPWSGGQDNADCLAQLPAYGAAGALFMCPSDSLRFPGPSLKQMRGTAEVETPWLSQLDAVPGYRCSYDYLGAYTTAPITVPPPERGVPKVPLMWDLMSGGPGGATEPQTLDRVTMMNHAPGGGNVLWMDGSVTFIPTREWPEPNLPYRPADIEFINTYEPHLQPEDMSGLEYRDRRRNDL